MNQLQKNNLKEAKTDLLEVAKSEPVIFVASINQLERSDGKSIDVDVDKYRKYFDTAFESVTQANNEIFDGYYKKIYNAAKNFIDVYEDVYGV